MRFLLILGTIQMITELLILVSLSVQKKDKTSKTVAIIQTIIKATTIIIIISLLAGGGAL